MKSALLATALTILSPGAVAAERAEIVVTLKPLHSLAVLVAGDLADVRLLIDDNASPHNTSLSPAAVRMLHHADLVLWTDDGLETFLPAVVDSLTHDPVLMEASALDGILKLATRHAGPSADPHDQGEANHDHASLDPHLWLDTGNAVVMVRALADRLISLDAGNADGYRANLKRALDRIDRLDRQIRPPLQALGGHPFVVFHDAFQYFEHDFGLLAAGVVTLHPEQSPGARRISEIRGLVADTGARCIFTEPQFSPRLIHTITEGLNIRTASLDPLGAGVKAGAGAWFEIMTGLADSLSRCLLNGS